MSEITIDAIIENIDQVTDFVNEALEEADCSMKVQMQVDIVIDEIFSNIARYAYPEGTGKAVVRVDLTDPKRLLLEFEDQGIPYNPLAKEDPDITLSAEEREIGGLGIFLAKNIMDELSYEYRGGRNLLRAVKAL